MSKKRFSIIVPFKNISDKNKEFLKSLNNINNIEQFELLFVLGDKELNIQKVYQKISHFIKHKFTLLQDHENNSGPSRCWCIGLKAAKGEYICFLAADLIPDDNWCSTILKNINIKNNKKFWIGNIYNSYKKNKYNYLDMIEMQIDKRRYEELIVDFRNFIGEKKALINIINKYFNNKYFSDIELDFILKYKLKISPTPLSDLIVYNKYPEVFMESVKRKFKHGVGDGIISKKFIDKFRKIRSFGIYDIYLGVVILFNETKKAKLSIINRFILAFFNIIFLTGMLFGVFMPKYLIKRYYTLHFDEKK